jgi:hypothetical protein
MARALGSAVLLAAATLAHAEQDARGNCLAAGLSGRYFVASGQTYSWTLIVDDHCRYTSLRFSGDPENDVAQPTQGVAKLAQVDGRDVLILQSSEGEFSEVVTAVRVGPRLYLVPPNQHPRFCIEWKRGAEPRRGPVGRYLLRGGDEGAPVARGETPAICQPR